MLCESIQLRCGVTLPNRIVKAAMTEGLADEYNQPTGELCKLYSTWCKSGAAVLITGNVVIDRRYLERPGNVAIPHNPSDTLRSKLMEWARASTSDNTMCWVQLSHAGRQSTPSVCLNPVGPSNIGVTKPSSVMPDFGVPRALSDEEIEEIVTRFAEAASVVKSSGFGGVQIHAAHGYLLSSFLSPKVNNRSGPYGGELSGRTRILMEVIDAVRDAVGESYPVSVKINSSDFQKGGFTHEEAIQVVEWIDSTCKVDMVEVSGGNIENVALLGGEGFMNRVLTQNSTLVREAYFVEFAHSIRSSISHGTRLMVTGGFRSRTVMEEALVSGKCDLIGVARPFCGDGSSVPDFLTSPEGVLPSYENSLKLPSWLRCWIVYFPIGRAINVFSKQLWFYTSMIRMGQGLPVDHNLSLISTAITAQRLDDSKAAALKDVDTVGLITNVGTRGFFPC